MDAAPLEFLQQMLATPSPSGYEQPVQRLVREYLAPYAEEVRTDVHGNVIAVKNAAAPLRAMLTGHADQIGFCVQHIDADGYIYFLPIGGWDPIILIGQRVVLWTAGGPIPGIVGRKPIHLLTDEERKQVPKLKDLWIDIGAKNKDEVAEHVRVGDPITLDQSFQRLRNQLACSPAMDDKAGVWVAVEGFRRAVQRGVQCALYCVSTVQEEIGLRGAQTSSYQVDPHVAIAVDVTHATDCPTIEKKSEGDIRLGSGPVVYRGPNMNPIVVDRLLSTAKVHNLPVQLAASGRATSTDANVLQTSRGGVAVGLVSIPNRYMHTPVETISLTDLDQAAELLAGFACDLKPGDDFTPGLP